MISIQQRQLLAGLVLPFLVFLSVGMILAGQIWSGKVAQIRMMTAREMTPVYNVLTFGPRQFHKWQIMLQGVGDLLAENARLREENRQLAHWYGMVQSFQFENRRLKSLLHWGSEPRQDYVSGWVVRDESGPYLRAVLLDVGTHSTVHVGNLAVDSVGLAGRVSEVGPHVVRVLLIEDAASRIPVTLQSSGGDAMMIGDNTPYPRLVSFTQNAHPQEGEHVETRGQMGLVGGVPVGHVHYLPSGRPVVVPDADLSRLNLVRIFDGETGVDAPPASDRVGEKAPLLPADEDSGSSSWKKLRRLLPFSSTQSG